MTSDQNEKYNQYIKKAWIIYSLIIAVMVLVLVLFVAEDNEEKFFFTIMPIAAAYVFRPMNRPFSKLIFKFTGAKPPEEKK